MRTRVLATLLGAAFAIGAPCAAHADDLLQYYREALSNDAQFGSARSLFRANQEKLPQGQAGMLPQVSLSGLMSRTHADIENRALPDTWKNYYTYTYTLQLTQPLFRWSNLQQVEIGKLSVLLAEAQLGQAGQDLAVRVAQAYFDVLATEDNITFITAQKAAITEQLASAKRNFEVGTATITDTNEAQARYDLAVASELAARNDLNIKRTNLQQIIGRPPGLVAPLRAGVELTQPAPLNIEPWVENAEKGNFGVLQQQANLEIAGRNIEVNRAGRYPNIDLIASRGLNKTPVTSPVLSTTASVIGVQLSIPLYTGGLAESRIRESIALRERSEQDLENSRRVAAQAARQAFFGVNSGLSQIKALQAAETSSLTALESNRLGYEVGVRINIDVLNAQQQLFQTRRDLAKARYDTLMNSLRLKSATGALKEDDLGLINGLLAR